MKKKIFVILLCGFFLLGTVGCSEKNNSIKLTLDNYSEYLNISVTYGVDDYSDKFYDNADSYSKNIRTDDETEEVQKLVGTAAYRSIKNEVNVTGASINYNYENVKIIVKISGTYDYYKYKDLKYYHIGLGMELKEKFDNELRIKCNIGGMGKESKTKDINGYTPKDSINLSYDVVEVYGYVTPIR